VGGVGLASRFVADGEVGGVNGVELAGVDADVGVRADAVEDVDGPRKLLLGDLRLAERGESHRVGCDVVAGQEVGGIVGGGGAFELDQTFNAAGVQLVEEDEGGGRGDGSVRRGRNRGRRIRVEALV